MINVVLNFTENPDKDIPQDKKILFHDGDSLEIGFRKGGSVFYGVKNGDEIVECSVNVNWIKHFVVIGKQ